MSNLHDALLQHDDEARTKAGRYHLARERLTAIQERCEMHNRRSARDATRWFHRSEKLADFVERVRPFPSETPTGLAIWIAEQLQDLLPAPGVPDPHRNTDPIRCEQIFECADGWYATLLDEGYPLPVDLCRRSDANLVIHLHRMMDACTRWRERSAAAAGAGLPAGSFQPPGNKTPLSQQSGGGDRRTHPNGRGTDWKLVKTKAEAHVKANRGVFPGFNALTKLMRCSKSTLQRAIRDSQYLKARKAEHDRNRRSAGRESSLTDAVLDHTPQSTEADPLKALINDQQEEQNREDRQYLAARRDRSR